MITMCIKKACTVICHCKLNHRLPRKPWPTRFLWAFARFWIPAIVSLGNRLLFSDVFKWSNYYATGSNDKAIRQEYAAQLKKQIQTQKALKSRPSNA